MMKISRRSLIAAAGALPLVTFHQTQVAAAERATAQELDRAASRPLLDLRNVTEPVTISSMELLRNGNEFLVRVRSADGAEGIIVANSGWLGDTYPIFQNRVASLLIGKDARDVETLLEDLLRPNITYKLQGLALWVCVAAAEMAILELLGRVSQKSIGELFGGVRRDRIAVYRADHQKGTQLYRNVARFYSILRCQWSSASSAKPRFRGLPLVVLALWPRRHQ